MKKIFTVALLLSCSAVFAQQTVVVTRKTMTGAEANRMFSKITDPKIYDMSGNLIDSVKAAQMVKTFDYTMGRGTPVGQTETKRVLFKSNHAMDARIDKETRVYNRPKSEKLHEGVVLDLKPFAKHATRPDRNL